MKVLLVSLYYLPKIGGVETSLRYLSKKLVEKGHEVAILTFDSTSNQCVIEEINNILVYRFKSQRNRIPHILHSRIKKIAQKAIEEVIPHFRPDEIWTRNSIVAAGILKSRKVKKIKHIFSTTSQLNTDGLYNNINDHGYVKRLIIRFLKVLDYLSLFNIDKALLKTDKVIPIVFSNMMKTQLIEEQHTDKIIHVIRPGVDREIFNRDCANKNKLINQFPSLDQKFALYVGRVANSKNVDVLIDSLKLIGELNLVIVGDGPQLMELKEKINRDCLTNRVLFMGPQYVNLPLIYALAEVTILPTKIETFGQVLIESLSCGTPVIGFGNNKMFKTAIAEIVLTASNGTIVNEFSSVALASAISLFENIDEKKKKIIAQENIKYVEMAFNWDVTVENLLNIS